MASLSIRVVADRHINTQTVWRSTFRGPAWHLLLGFQVAKLSGWGDFLACIQMSRDAGFASLPALPSRIGNRSRSSCRAAQTILTMLAMRRIGSVRMSSNKMGSDKVGSDKIGSEKIGSDKGLDWLMFNK